MLYISFFRDWLFVHPSYQGLGIGRALLEHSQNLAELMDPLAFPYPISYIPSSRAATPQPPPSSIPSVIPSPYSSNTSLDTDLDNLELAVDPEPRKVKIFLEASRAGTPVYTRLGFRPISRSTIEYKGEQVSWPVMLWEGTMARS